jgi:hypothetical protein
MITSTRAIISGISITLLYLLLCIRQLLDVRELLQDWGNIRAIEEKKEGGKSLDVDDDQKQ